MSIRKQGKLKIGLIVPSVQVVTEPLYYEVAGNECEFFTTRLLIQGGGKEALLEMSKSVQRAVRELVTAKVEIMAYCCTGSGVFHGYEAEQELCRQVKQETGIPFVTTMLSVVAALRHVKARRIAFVSPYPEATNEAGVAYFDQNGFEIVSAAGQGIKDGFSMSQVPPAEITRFALEHWDAQADALLMSCMNWRAMRSVAEIEAAIGKPVITSHNATLWNALRAAGEQPHWPEYGSWMSH